MKNFFYAYLKALFYPHWGTEMRCRTKIKLPRDEDLNLWLLVLALGTIATIAGTLFARSFE